MKAIWFKRHTLGTFKRLPSVHKWYLYMHTNAHKNAKKKKTTQGMIRYAHANEDTHVRKPNGSLS